MKAGGDKTVKKSGKSCIQSSESEQNSNEWIKNLVIAMFFISVLVLVTYFCHLLAIRKPATPIHRENFIDSRGGFRFTVPDELIISDRGEYYLLYPPSDDFSLYVISNSDVVISSAYDYLIAVRGLRERMEYVISDKSQKTLLYDPNPHVENVRVGGFSAVVEYADVYLGKQVYRSVTTYLIVDGRGVAIGCCGEDSKHLLDRVLSTLTPITATENVALTTESIMNVRITYPNNWEKYERPGIAVYSAPAETNSSWESAKIIILKDRSAQDNPFQVIDRTFEISNTLYSRALSQNPSIEALRILTYKLLSEQERCEIDGNTFYKVDVNLKLVSTLREPISTLTDYSLRGVLFSSVSHSESLNVLFCGLDDVSFENMKDLIKKFEEAR